jgi:hypothetical protein
MHIKPPIGLNREINSPEERFIKFLVTLMKLMGKEPYA